MTKKRMSILLSPEIFDGKKLSDEELDDLNDIGYMLEKGILFEQNYEAAMELFTKCASYGHAKALNNLGWMYHNGLGVPVDYKKAEDYYTLAAINGETSAMINLGNIYEYNEKDFDKIDWKKAREWYHRAALMGDNRAKFNYANCLHYGHGGAKDYDAAFFIFHQLAGVVKGAYYYLGLYYENGFAVHKNLDMAARYYSLGAEEEKDGYCCIQLGNILSKIKDSPDYDTAKKLYFIGIKYGDNLGYANIGCMYEEGRIGNLDAKKRKEMAIKWYQLGAKSGEEHAKEMLKKHHVKEAEKLDYTLEDLAKEL